MKTWREYHRNTLLQSNPINIITKDLKEIGAPSLISLINHLIKLLHSFNKNNKENKTCCYNHAQALVDICWERIHFTGHWRDVPHAIRDSYTIGQLGRVLSESDQIGDSRDVVQALDMAILLGGRSFRSVVLSAMNDAHREALEEYPLPSIPSSSLSLSSTLSSSSPSSSLISIPNISDDNQIERSSVPNVDTFYRNHFNTQIPVVLTQIVDHWDALNTWTWSFLRENFGHRLVPIELGKDYMSEEWGQQLMPFYKFIDDYILKESNTKGYLAQHFLFDQIPELRRYFTTPEYCMLGEGDLKTINGWFGPANTVSPLHTDPYHNILVQVRGRKYIRLYDPQYTDEGLYPHRDGVMTNTSQVNVEDPDLQRFPRFGSVPFTETILEAGEALYIPRGHWHYVRSLDSSISISFWWN